MKALLMSMTLLFIGSGVFAKGVDHSGGGDSYLRFNCVSKDQKTRLAGDVGISCSHSVNISGDITQAFDQTCDSDEVRFIYSEAARTAGKIVVSGEKTLSVFHLSSQGAIKFKTDGRDINKEAFDFTGEFTYSTWVDGERRAVSKIMICSGESVAQP